MSEPDFGMDAMRQPQKPTLARRLRYAFDHTLSHGPSALILWLALATGLLVALAVGVTLLLGARAGNAGGAQLFWNYVFQALVPNPPGDLTSPWPFLVIMLLVSIAGLGVVSILIGLLSAIIQNRLETLRRGRIPIIESGHTVVLGWGDQAVDIVAGLVAANKEERKTAIAILGDEDKVEMEEEIRRRVKSTGKTKVVCRRGSSIQHADLDLVSPQTSRSIIILPGHDAEQPDAMTLKTIMALTKAPNRRPEPYHIVAVLRRERNLEIAKLVGGDEVEVLLSGIAVARVIAQTCRQSGLAVVYEELLDPAGDQIYFREEPGLEGQTYGEALFRYRDSALIGLLPRGGKGVLNPSMDTVIREGDQVIAIAADESAIRLWEGPSPSPEPAAIQSGTPTERGPERTLIIGWNWRGMTVVRQLDAYVAKGSTVTVMAQHETVEADVANLAGELRNQEVSFRPIDIQNRDALELLWAESYDHTVVLAYSDTLEDQRADALTLLTLLYLRSMADERGRKFSLVSEMMDVRNRDLAVSGRGDDFIVSDKLISLIMTQISQNKAMVDVLVDLVDPAGAEIYLKPALDYVKPGVPVSFYTVVEAARRRGETAMGYRIHAFGADRTRAYGVVVNPAKDVTLTFAEGDRVIVVAED